MAQALAGLALASCQGGQPPPETRVEPLPCSGGGSVVLPNGTITARCCDNGELAMDLVHEVSHLPLGDPNDPAWIFTFKDGMTRVAVTQPACAPSHQEASKPGTAVRTIHVDDGLHRKIVDVGVRRIRLEVYGMHEFPLNEAHADELSGIVRSARPTPEPRAAPSGPTRGCGP